METIGTPKSKWASKTLWVNALTVIAGGITAMSLPDAQMGTQTVGILGVALGIVNVILRFLTSKPIE